MSCNGVSYSIKYFKKSKEKYTMYNVYVAFSDFPSIYLTNNHFPLKINNVQQHKYMCTLNVQVF